MKLVLVFAVIVLVPLGSTGPPRHSQQNEGMGSAGNL